MRACEMASAACVAATEIDISALTSDFIMVHIYRMSNYRWSLFISGSHKRANLYII